MAYLDAIVNAPGLANYWPMDEVGFPAKARDAKGSAPATRTGNVQFGPQYDLVVGESNGGASFLSAQLLVPATVAINGTWSVEALVQPVTAAGGLSYIGSRTGGDHSFDVQLTSGTTIHGDVGDGTNWLSTALDAAVSYVALQKLHVLYSVTPTGGSVFVDGALIASVGWASAVPMLCDATRLLRMGNNGVGNSWDGVMAHVALYTVAVPQYRIWQHARIQQGKERRPKDPPHNTERLFTLNDSSTKFSCVYDGRSERQTLTQNDLINNQLCTCDPSIVAQLRSLNIFTETIAP